MAGAPPYAARAKAAMDVLPSNLALDVCLLALVAGLGASGRFDVPNGGGVRVRDLALLYALSFLTRNAYNAYLEWAYRAGPRRLNPRSIRVSDATRLNPDS